MTVSRHSVAKVLIRDVIIPLCGVGLAFFLASQPGERFSLTVLAGAMMGVPFVSRLDQRIRDIARTRADEQEESER